MKRKEYIPNCIKVSNPCQRHLDGSYLHHACGEKYPHKERLPFTNSHKEKIRLALTGKKLSKQHIENLKGRIPYNKGTKGLCKVNSTSFKKGNLSWNKGLPKEKSHRYIKDRTKVKYNVERGGVLHARWSKKVKERDGFKCKINDGNCNGSLESHHILRWHTFPELRYDINNGITLCKFHHPRKIKDEMHLSPMFIKLISN